MGTKTKHKQPEPAPFSAPAPAAPKQSRRDILVQAAKVREAELARLQQKHQAAVDHYVDTLDPAVEVGVTTLARQIAEAAARLANINAALDRVEEQERAQRVEAARHASAADRELASRQIGEPMLDAAAEFDLTIDAAVAALRKFKHESGIAAGALRRALAVEYRGEDIRRDDLSAVLMPKVQGISETYAAALAAAMRRLRDALDSPALQAHVGFNDFIRRDYTLRHAVELEGQIVRGHLA